MKKVFIFHYFSLCVRLRILQIGTPLKIVSNRYIFHHYNTTDCLFIYLYQKVPNWYISLFFWYVSVTFHFPPLKKMIYRFLYRLCTSEEHYLKEFYCAVCDPLKVRLRWFGAVLQHTCKHVFFLSSFNISIGIIYH